MKLKGLFQFYNRKYFRGKLPKCTVFFYKKLDHKSWIGEFWKDGDTYHIGIKNEIRNDSALVKTTLLHEMIHLKHASKGKRPTHQIAFYKEIIRLVLAGAYKGLL